MRRRVGERLGTAEEHVRLYDQAVLEAGRRFTRDDPARAVWLRHRLAEHDTDPVTCLMARVWLRRGRPRDYWPAIRERWTS